MIRQPMGKPMGKPEGNQQANGRSQHRILIAAVLCMQQESHTQKPRRCTSSQEQGFVHYFSPQKRPYTASKKQTYSKGAKNKSNREGHASGVHDSETARHCKPAGVGVHAAGWLIQEDDCRATQEGNGYAQLASLPTRQIASGRVQLAIKPCTNNNYE